MTDQLDQALARLVKESRADGALVWSRSAPAGDALVLGGYPTGVAPGPLARVVPAGTTTGTATPDPADLAALLPETLIRQLPGAPVAARSLNVGDDLALTLVWCDPAASPDLTADRPGQALDEVRAVAALVRQIHVAEDDVERLRAVVNGLQDGVVTLIPHLGQAAVNTTAAEMLDIPQGRHPESDFTAALAALARRALNHDEIDSCIKLLESDPNATIECTWRFAGQPSHLFVVSRPVEYRGFRGRNWIFYDESQSAQTLESLERTHALLRASADGMLDPQALLEAVRDSSGEIVDFVYRDVNQATWAYLETTREELIGRTLLETMPNLKPSGLLARYAECANTRIPVILDEVPYDNEMLTGPRRYDIRGTYVGGDFITLTWRDVTERVETFHRLAESEERFRLLAENAGDVVAYLRDGVIDWVSPSVAGVLGAPPEHWIGRHMTETIPADELPNQAEIIGRITAGEVVLARARVHAVDGTTHWIHLHGKRFYDASGEPDGLTIAFRVIDDEVRLEQDAEDARRSRADADARYRQIVDSSAIGMSLVTPDGRYEEVNQALCDFFGYDAETLKTKTWQELTTGDTLERDLRKTEDALAGRIDQYRLTKQYIHADGHLIWADLSVSCVRDAEGHVEYFVSQAIDITAEVESRRRVAERDQQNRALTQRLQAQTARLRSELKVAGAYVTSLLPGDLEGPVQVSHRYLPSSELGGDCFDYRWIDDDHLLIYLIDVSGHGIAPALESISVHNLLRSGALPTRTLLEPSQVLTELNSKFPMDEHGGNFFTMWYGMYEAPTRTLRYSSAGHPPALAFPRPGDEPVQLSSRGFPIGMFDDGEFGYETYVVPQAAEIVIYSDGAFELPLPQGAMWSLPDFAALCTALAGSGDWSVDDLAEKLRARTVAGLFDDDCSLLRLRFG